MLDGFDFIRDIIDLDSCDLQEDQFNCLSFTDVVFLKDFGPWKLAEKVDNIVFDFFNGCIEEYSNEGVRVKHAYLSLGIK
jgi:hypothetical protein